MPKNSKIISEFEKLVDFITYQIDNAVDNKEKIINGHRLRQTKNVLSILKKFNKEIKTGDELKNIKGVGKGSILRVKEILKTGKLKEIKLKKTLKKDLEYIEQLEQIINIGRKTAVDLVKKHNIKTIDELKKAHKDKKIELNDKILLGLKYFDKHKTNIPRKETMKIESFLKTTASQVDNKFFMIICGSYRRLKKTSNDIDVLLTHPNIKTMNDLKKKGFNYLRKFVDELKKQKFLLDDLTDKNFIHKYMGFCKFKNNPIRRIDIRFVPNNSYYYSLLYFTGSGNFNKQMREHAINLGFKLNEYGLYDINTKESYIATSEKDIFDKLGMEYLEPEQRL